MSIEKPIKIINHLWHRLRENQVPEGYFSANYNQNGHLRCDILIKFLPWFSRNHLSSIPFQPPHRAGELIMNKLIMEDMP